MSTGDAYPDASTAATLRFRSGRFETGLRDVPAETAVAISVNGSTHAVMMATPADLDDLAVGLALNEGIVDEPSQIERLDIAPTHAGIDCRLWLTHSRSASYVARRRQMTGPVGCGLCGVESLELAARALPAVAPGLLVPPGAIVGAMAALGERQTLGRRTRAAHAAGFASAQGALLCVREDVGRHNALDKVAGHMGRADLEAGGGFLVLTSRVSVELIQKAAVMGCGLLAAVSVPTALAIAEAERAGVTLVAVVRGDEFEVFTHPGRIAGTGGAGAVGGCQDPVSRRTPDTNSIPE